ncbi:MAG: hypothetical protein A2268_08290 [Candidatus Raymondbacteria bacterium RifOxyA12_full_50_37]|uniref:Prenyltransferase n=1 Tax=Candidatus Raymondbacteria bacterium RIFOXYD12_FULL_49_13 TaxID=1817890 RepID=A0A1F7FFN5_UNCRA|nr:MAG: hypothetical protein A2268_08290 [Candidatus Raymondbacteria bacterium RifOxyA12_full_50_37]OGJ92853.1 MAG: hypothetical protein A2248_07080 [Candidatus Raymondbacteria bacterium RIFOXYA2_FULL_49_16]OGJ99145.1 MAG: hypothetical protein A2453_09225 [Candidatus Raymondbacteria bacterium RIFOXYC2_FULL_50_21]OGK01609.1 MAG: hypothetical protein A2350_06175 [Candidatus Raymondbacteria bacterium RifOxyB12_full_50_8]OGK05272.1 MAG: hypothetical protein A2519_02750 [Candidatus Raymondbacteria b
MIRLLFFETRPKFLLLPFAVVFLGSAIAKFHGYTHPAWSLLCLAGLLLLHISTNVLNDYFDYKSGIDQRTTPTPFSGGSGYIISGVMKPAQVLWFGVIAFSLALPIGAYFVYMAGLKILWIFVLGAIVVLFGTSHLTRLGFGIAEMAAGLGLGLLPVFGTSLILQSHASPAALYASVPSGFLAFNLLLLNEFPDVQADAAGGRHTLAIELGLSRSAFLYAGVAIAVFGWIGVGVALGFMPKAALACFLFTPVSFAAIQGAFAHASRERLLKAMGANIAVTLGVQFCLALSFFYQL